MGTFDWEDIGREKFRDGLDGLAGLAGRASTSSDSTTLDSLLACRDVVGGGLLKRTTPCPAELGDVTRCGRSKLAALWCAFGGIGGIGGDRESRDSVLLSGSPGEAARNVRSVIEPLLLDRWRPGRPASLPPLESAALPFDEVEPLRTMRFV